ALGVDQRVDVVEPGRRFVDSGGWRDVAPAGAGDLHHLHVTAIAVLLVQLRDPVLRSVQPAGEVVADPDGDASGRLGAEVRIEGQQTLDLVERPLLLPRQCLQFLARQPAEAPLDLHQHRDQARTPELARTRFDARHGRLLVSRNCHCAEPPTNALSRSRAGAMLTAQNLNSGILPNGSISSIVSRLAAASRKWNGMKQLPRASRCETFTSSSMLPRRDLTRARSPSSRPSPAASSGWMNTSAFGAIASSAKE